MGKFGGERRHRLKIHIDRSYLSLSGPKYIGKCT